MIYTVTFNPSLDYIVSVEDFKLGLTNRTSSELILPGGKGINVSTVLGNLGIENTALGFLAGFTGKEIERRLKEMGVASDFIEINEGVSRINLKLKSIDGTEINGSGPLISAEDVEKLMGKLDKLGEGDVLFLAGSIPTSMPDDMYQKIMAKLDGKGVMIVVDATRDLARLASMQSSSISMNAAVMCLRYSNFSGFLIFAVRSLTRIMLRTIRCRSCKLSMLLLLKRVEGGLAGHPHARFSDCQITGFPGYKRHGSRCACSHCCGSCCR